MPHFTRRFGFVAILLSVLAGGAVVWGQTKAAPTKPAPTKAAPAKPEIAVYKSPTCGCCGKWIEHMQANGFTATTTNLADVTPIKTKHQVPVQLQSCHTSLVGGYVIEGHVPAEDIRRLLRERPAVVGLAAPGMPAGSPGMDVPGSPPYQVLTFDKDGRTKVFATHTPK